MSLCQFFHNGPGVGSTELCPLERPQYQALAMQTRWKALPWSRSSAPLFKVLLLPCRQGENHPHGVFFLLFNPRSSRRLSWAVCSSFLIQCSRRSVEKQMHEQCKEGEAWCWMNCLPGQCYHYLCHHHYWWERSFILDKDVLVFTELVSSPALITFMTILWYFYVTHFDLVWLSNWLVIEWIVLLGDFTEFYFGVNLFSNPGFTFGVLDTVMWWI